VARLRERYPRWGKDKLVVLLRREANLLGTADAARTFLEHRYLGMSALFPDLAGDWATLLRRVDDLAGLAAEGSPASEGDEAGTWPPDRVWLVVLAPGVRRSAALGHARIAAADLVDAALWRTLRYVGDPEAAQAVQARRLSRATRRTRASGS
jgi:hypothetical protein